MNGLICPINCWWAKWVDWLNNACCVGRTEHLCCMKNNIIQTQDLQYQFGKQAVLHNVSLQVPQGSIYGFLGPNGAGKTTTIRLLLGLLKPSAGDVKVFNSAFSDQRIPILSRIGSLIETPSLYLHLTGYENLLNACILRQVKKVRIAEVLELVRLTKDAGRRVKEYSLGMKQRLGLAIALLSEPDLLILDEPTNGLDPNGILEIRELLQKLNREKGITVFLSSHLLPEMEKVATHIGIIHKGNMMFQGSMAQLQSNGSHLQIDCSDNLKAAQLLAATAGLTMVNGEGFRLPYQSREQVALIIRSLVQHEIDVYRVAVAGNDLENIFLQITEN